MQAGCWLCCPRASGGRRRPVVRVRWCALCAASGRSTETRGRRGVLSIAHISHNAYIGETIEETTEDSAFSLGFSTFHSLES